MKLAFITLAASLLGAVLVTASASADRETPDTATVQARAQVKAQDRAPMTERAEPIRLAEVSPCAPAAGSFACVQSSGGKPDEHRGPPSGMAPAPDRPFPPPGFGQGGPGMGGPGPLMLASRLSAIEIFIGIRADQLETWRAYTDVLQVMIRPPVPEDFEGDPPDVLTQSTMLARRVAERGQYALALAAAVEELRGKLSPDQLERLKQAGPLLPPHPPGPGFGPPPFFGPASFGPPGPGGPGTGGHITPP